MGGQELGHAVEIPKEGLAAKRLGDERTPEESMKASQT